MVDIIGRTTPVSSVKRVFFLVKLGKSGLHKSCGRTQQSDQPHPEHSSCSSCGNSRHYAYQISHSHPSSSGYDQRLDPGDCLFLSFTFLFRNHPDHIRKHPERKESGPDGKVNPRRDQDQYQKRDSQRTPSRQGDSDKISP